MVDLSEQIDILDSAFLSRIPANADRPLNEEERALVRGYLVLAHAILEERLEDAITAYFDDLTGSLDGAVVPRDGVSLAFAAAKLSEELGHQVASFHDVPRLLSGLGRSALLVQLRKNHGLKEDNVKQLARLVGLNWQETEAALSAVLPDLNTLGSKRGEAGHISPFSAAATAISDAVGPDEVREWVANGRIAIEQIVAFLSARLVEQISHKAPDPALESEPEQTGHVTDH